MRRRLLRIWSQWSRHVESSGECQEKARPTANTLRGGTRNGKKVLNPWLAGDAMGGWFVDVIFGYFITLFRILARIRRTNRSKAWREVTATICGATCQTQSYAPRPIAEIVYTYRVDGGLYGGVDEKPFFLASDARGYVKQFTRGDMLVVRVKPGEFGTSIVTDYDLKRAIRQSGVTSRSDLLSSL